MLKGWRTVLVNAGIALLAVAAELMSYLAVFDWRSVLPEGYVPYVILGVNVINIVLKASVAARSPAVEGDVHP